MKIKLSILLIVLTFSTNVMASRRAEALSNKAISENSAVAAPAISELRALGPAGFDSLLSTYAGEIKRHTSNPFERATPEWLRITAALDAVSQQKDSYLSRLFWYTDLNQAKAAAKATGKPILSLRLLGNLNEEFSCANSRFFRTVLYSNTTVSDVLREGYILHWQSVRPAPRITIDFGDGRKLERTITGNSIHYVLSTDGQIIDALPGLYGPAAFLSNLAKTEGLNKILASKSTQERLKLLADYHQNAVKAVTTDWAADARQVGGKIPDNLLPQGKGQRAVDIAPLAVTKAITEFPILQSMMRDADALKAITDEPTWNSIAWRHINEARLDAQSIGLIKAQMADAWGDGAIANNKLLALLQRLQKDIALDTARNEYVLHTQLHAWLATGFASFNLKEFNEKVYAELFKTPKSDPWLGLTTEDTYVGLQSGGVIRK
ncbi:MAG TPA: hypothetical protein VGN86_12390 [Pyrinomonadaceae bacterium]|nr:hypothetical protein [Pyrinomonadaceae bacterium]